MPEYKSKSPDTGANRTLNGQCAAILDELLVAEGAWVPLPQIMQHAAQYNSRLYTLRKLGHKIENKTEVHDGVRHSWYRLVLTDEIAPASPDILHADPSGLLFDPNLLRAEALRLCKRLVKTP